MMTGDLSELSVPLTSTLLLRYIEQVVAPPDPLGQAGGSLVLGKIKFFDISVFMFTNNKAYI